MPGEWTMWSISKYFGDRYRETIDAKIQRYRARANDPRVQLGFGPNQLPDFGEKVYVASLTGPSPRRVAW